LRSARRRPAKKGPVAPPRVFVLGFGNPGRRDDGLGAAAAERLAARGLPGLTCDANYQLQLEDALACANHDVVVFIDAARGLRVPFAWSAVHPEPPAAMSHSLGPGGVLALCAALYGRFPEAHLLAIRGHRWGLGEGLSPRAEGNLAAALDFLEGFLRKAARPGGGQA